MKYNFDYKTILNSLPHAVLMTDLSLNIIFANDVCIALYGLDRDSYIGSPCSIIQTEDCKNLSGFIDNLKHGLTETINFTDNRGRVFQLTGSRLFTRGCEHIGYTITGIDITELKAAEMNLKISDERFRIALPHTKSGIWEYDPVKKTLTRETDGSPFFNIPTTTYNMPHALISSEMIHPDSVPDIYRLFSDLDNGANYAEAEIKMLTNDNRVLWYRLAFTGIYNLSNKPIKAIGISSDITSKKEIEIRANQERQYLDSLVAGAISVFEVNLTRNELERSSVPNDMPLPDTDICVHLLKGGKYWNVVDEDVARLEALFSTRYLLREFNKGNREIKHEYRCRNGQGDYWVRAEANLVGPGENGDIYVFIQVKNINTQKENEQALRKKASLDPLTGLLNRDVAKDRIEKTLAGRKRDCICCMYMIDVDNFKMINDTYGHLSGDSFLVSLSDELVSFFRKDDIICRMGGDEFLIFVCDISKSMAAKKAESLNRMLISFASDELGHKKNTSATISIGLAFAETEHVDFNMLYDRADRALYEAKNKGKNQYAIYDNEKKVSDLYD